MHLVIWFRPYHYPNGLAQVELIGKLLSSITLMWFVSLLECQSPFFNNFEAFVEKFNATFGESNKEHTSTTSPFTKDHTQLMCMDLRLGNEHVTSHGMNLHSWINFNSNYLTKWRIYVYPAKSHKIEPIHYTSCLMW